MQHNKTTIDRSDSFCMNANIKELIDNYWDWLKDSTTLKEINGWSEITTPYLDRHNDFLQIYASEEENGGYILTDDSWTIHAWKIQDVT